MHLDWITHPLVTDALFTCGLGASVLLFYSLKREICRVQQGSLQAFAAISVALETANANLAAIRAAFDKCETTQAASDTTMDGQGKQARAAGTIDHCEPHETVAQTKSIPECEVDLLLKVQRIIAKNAGPEKAGSLSTLPETAG